MNINRENEEQFTRLDESLDKKFGKSFFISNKENLGKLINERKSVLLDYISKHDVETKDVDINELVPNPYNRALDPKAVEETGKNIKESGVIKPIIYVEFDPHTLQKPFNETKKPLKMVIDGHHRLEALKQSGHKTVPAIKATNGILTSDKEKEVEVEKKDETQKGLLTDMAVIAAGDLAAEGVAHGISHFLKPKKPKMPKAPKTPLSTRSSDVYMGTPETTKSEGTVDLSKAIKLSAIKPIISAVFNRKLLSRNVFERTMAQGGHTVSLAGKSPKTGFAFSPYKSREAIIPKAQFSHKHVDSYVQRNKDLLSQPNHHIGSWHNTETGNVHLDVSVVHPNKVKALSEAAKHKQLAIYDLGAGKEISLGKDAASSAVKPREKGKTFLKSEDSINISSDEIKAIGDRLGVNWEKTNLDQLVQGAKVELEHSDVTGGNMEDTIRIALAHLDELPDYYTRLAQMESGSSNSESTEKGIGSAILTGIKALKPVFPKTTKIPMPKNIMAGTLKELDTKYQTVLRQAAESATKKYLDKQDISKQVTRMTPTPEFAQANTGVDQEKINDINTELLNMYQVLQNIESRSKEEGILTEDELNSIVIPLKEELQRMMDALTPSDYQETEEEPVKEPEPGPDRQVGTAERELINPSTNFADKFVTANDMKKQLVSMGGTGEGRGFHGDPERHAEAARERWEQEGVPPGGRQKPKAGTKPETPEGVLVIPKAIRDVAVKTARKAGNSLSRQAGEVIGELGWQVFGTIAGLILYRYLGGESTKVGELLSVGKQGLKEALRRGFELRRIDTLARKIKLARVVKEWSQLP
jgi:hypothetical protein